MMASLLALTFSGDRASGSGSEDSEYTWPVEKTRSLSSTFGEHRHFHFHSGIDIPTRGETGYKVLACQSGYVYRIFASWQGYGKAVYLKLDDGRFALYGHLSGFTRRVSELVVREQLKNRRYRIDLFPQENEIRVKRGELIAYSGESGWGGPHLHFEIRDSANNPINPLTSGFSVTDRIPPIMQYVALRPLELGARVNGSAEPAILPLSLDSKSGVYRPTHPLVIEGEVGLEISVYDKMDNSRFRFGVYGLDLYLDDSLLFASRYDRIWFETTHQIELDRDFELGQTQGLDFYRLYLEEGNELPLYNPAQGKMIARSTSSDSHQVRIEAFDASGNVCVADFLLVFDRGPMILSCAVVNQGAESAIRVVFEDPDDAVKEVVVEGRALGETVWHEIKRAGTDVRQGEQVIILGEGWTEPALIRATVKDGFGAASEQRYLVINSDRWTDTGDGNSFDLDYRYSFRNNTFVFDLEFSQIPTGVPEFSLRSDKFDFDPLFCEQTGAASYRATFPFYLNDQKEMILLARASTLHGDSLRVEKTLPVAIVTKSSGGVAVSADGQAKVEIASNVVYQDINVSITTMELKQRPGKEPVGNVYSFEPSAVPLSGRAKVALVYPRQGCNPRRLGLYELKETGSWSHVGQDLDTSNSTVGGSVRYLSSYTLLEDTLSPEVNRISIHPGARINNKRPRITAVITDDLSGIGDDRDIVMKIDGEWMIPEYDVEKRILSTRPIAPLTPGRHLLSIWVCDRAGNETAVTREFYRVGN